LRLLWYQNGVAGIAYYISALSLCPKSKSANSGDIAPPLHSGKKNSPAEAGEGVRG